MKKKPSAILITATSRRLGCAFAKKSLAMGYAVIAHHRSGTGEFGTWLTRHPHYRRKVFFLQADLEYNPAQLLQEATQIPVTLHGLVNNASIFTPGALTDDTHFTKMLTTNTYAPLELARQFKRRIAAGWIINITDAHVTSLNRTYQNYRISKIFLTELTRQMAYAFAPAIRVNAIAPGPVLPAVGKSLSDFRAVVRRTPLRHAVHLECLMNAFSYLVENCCVTGEVLNVDSGWHLES